MVLSRIQLWWVFLLSAAGLSACSPTGAPSADFVVTIPPLKLILQEITGDGNRITCILPPGASPHTFELRPSTARKLGEAKAVFYVDESIDGWAARLAPGRLHSVFSMVPKALQRPYDVPHEHGSARQTGADPSTANAHFWSDPVVVRAIVPELVTAVSSADPDNAVRYAANGASFLAALDALDREFGALPAELGDYALVAFHPSWQYFCERYGITVTAYVEPFPGKEPTPQTIQALKAALSAIKRRVVLSEVQLPSRSARVLAESVGAMVAVIDPLGGQGDRNTYSGLLRYNAVQIRKALE